MLVKKSFDCTIFVRQPFHRFYFSKNVHRSISYTFISFLIFNIFLIFRSSRINKFGDEYYIVHIGIRLVRRQYRLYVNEKNPFFRKYLEFSNREKCVINLLSDSLYYLLYLNVYNITRVENMLLQIPRKVFAWYTFTCYAYYI